MTQLRNTIVYVFIYDLRGVIQCMYEVNNGKGSLCVSEEDLKRTSNNVG